MEGAKALVEESPRASQVDEAEEAMLRILQSMFLKNKLSYSSGQRSVGLFGAGSAPVEVGPLGVILGDILITAYDKEPNMDDKTKALLGNRIDGNFQYKQKDLRDPSSLEGEQFDLIVIRNPDVIRDEKGWVSIIRNGSDHLKKGGAILVTTGSHNRPFFMTELQKYGEKVWEYNIRDEDRVATFVEERVAFIVRKPLR